MCIILKEMNPLSDCENCFPSPNARRCSGLSGKALHRRSEIETKHGRVAICHLLDGDHVRSAGAAADVGAADDGSSSTTVAAWHCVKAVVPCWLKHPTMTDSFHRCLVFERDSIAPGVPRLRFTVDLGHPICSPADYAALGEAALKPAIAFYRRDGPAATAGEMRLTDWQTVYDEEEKAGDTNGPARSDAVKSLARCRYDLLLATPRGTYVANGVVVASRVSLADAGYAHAGGVVERESVADAISSAFAHAKLAIDDATCLDAFVATVVDDNRNGSATHEMELHTLDIQAPYSNAWMWACIEALRRSHSGVQRRLDVVSPTWDPTSMTAMTAVHDLCRDMRPRIVLQFKQDNQLDAIVAGCATAGTRKTMVLDRWQVGVRRCLAYADSNATCDRVLVAHCPRRGTPGCDGHFVRNPAISARASRLERAAATRKRSGVSHPPEMKARA